MATLTTLQGRGGGRIPTDTSSISLSRDDMARLMQRVATDLYPHKGYRAALTALQARPDAACLLREAASAYATHR